MSPRTKIGIVVPSLAGGGAEYVARQWAEYLSGEADVYVIATDFVDTQISHPFQVRGLDSFSFIGRAIELKRVVETEELDVLVGLMPYWNLMALAASMLGYKRRPKIVVSSHTIESNYGVNRRRSYAIQMLLAKLAYRFADAFVASSHPVAAEAVARYRIRRHRLWVIPNPVFATAVVSATRGLPNRPPKKPSSLVVPGRVVDQKRPGTAIDVAAALGRKWGHPPKVIFVGDGPAISSTRLKASAARVPTEFRTWDPDWTAKVPSDSLVLLPSMLEGFGNVLLDAAAAGLPIVTSSRALGVADAVLPGITAELVCGDSVDDYTSGVMTIVNNGMQRGDIVQQWLNRFTRESSGAQLSTSIASIVSGDRV